MHCFFFGNSMTRHMKKTFFALLVLMGLMVTNTFAADDDCMIYFRLNVDGKALTSEQCDRVGGSAICHNDEGYEAGWWQIERYPANTADGPQFVLRIPKESEWGEDNTQYEGRQLLFRVYAWGAAITVSEEGDAPFEGEFEIGGEAITLNGAVQRVIYQAGREWGSPDNPLQMDFVSLKSVSVPTTYTMAPGEKKRLSELLTFNPANASRPAYSAIYWNYGDSFFDYFDIEHDDLTQKDDITLTAKAVTPAEGITADWNYYVGREPYEGKTTFFVGIPVTGVRITDALPEFMWVGESMALDRTMYAISPADATNQQVAWSAGDTKILELTEAMTHAGYTLSARTAGATSLTVTTADGGLTDSRQVEVREHVSGLALTESNITVNRGATVVLDDYLVFTPASAYERQVRWSSEDESIAIVEYLDGRWTMTAQSPGQTRLVATSTYDRQLQAVLEVHITSSVEGITVANPSQVKYIGEAFDLSYTITPADATDKTVTWTSSDENVVSIVRDVTGGITAEAKGVGKATLTATTTDGRKTATITAEVRAHVASLTLTEQSLSVIKGQVIDLSKYVKIAPADAYDKSVTWASRDASVVSVSGSTATAVGVGTATLTVTSNDNRQATSTLTVTVTSSVEGITVANPSQVKYIGEAFDLSYTITPADASDKTVTWTSSDESVVSVTRMDAGYAAIAKGVGKATLTVTTADGRKTATIAAEVRSHVTSLTLTEQSVKMNRGQALDLTKYVAIDPDDAYDKGVTWTSDNAAVLSVSGTTATAVGIGTATLTATSNDNRQLRASMTVTVESSATGFFASYPVQEVWVGESVKLDTYFEPKDATSAIKSWTSSDEAVVSVSSGNGFSATAKKSGKATLTATTDNGLTATIAVTVKSHVESIVLTTATATLKKGTTADLSTYIKEILPADAYDKSVTWASRDAGVVSVSGSTATAVGVGTATLTVTSNDNRQAAATLTVTVTSSVEGITVANPSQVKYIGEAFDLSYTITPADASDKSVTWTSSDENVVSIVREATGGITATAKGVGKATLTVTTADGKKTATISAEVRAHVEGITLSQQAITLQRGSTQDLSQYVTIQPANAFNKEVTWKSGDESIVTVSGYTAVAKALGTTTLTVTSDDSPHISGTLIVTVEAAAAGIYAVKPVQTIAVGENADLSVFFEPKDATSAIKSWTSSDTNVMVISGNGTTVDFSATAKAAGKAVLTATTDNGQTTAIEITVCNTLQEISLTVGEATLEKGETLDLRSLILTEPADALYDLTIEYLPKEGSEYHFTIDKDGKVTALESTCGDSYEVEIRVTDGFGNTASAVINIGVTFSPTAISLEASKQSIPLGGEINLGYTILPEGADLPYDEEWSSSNKKVVSVTLTDEGWKATTEGVGQATLTLTLGDLQATIDVEVFSVVEYILLNTQSEAIKQGETICLDDFIIGFEPEDAADKRVIWKAEDEKIVSITRKEGKYYATGLAEGSTSLMVQSIANPDAASYMGLSVLTAIESIKALYPEQYVYTDTYVDLSVEILPTEAANRYVDWTCNVPEAVTFYSDTYTGNYMPQFNQYGDFTLTGTPDEGEHTCTITVHVVKHVEDIALTLTDSLTIDAGSSLSLDELIVFTPEDAYNKEVIWTSNDESVASVTCTDGHWTVNGAGSGIAMLNVVSADNPKAMSRIEVTVIQRVTGITVEEPVQEVYTGSYVNTAYTIQPADADIRSITYAVSDENVLGLEEGKDGYAIVALKPGKATVTLTTDDGGHTATIEVTVRQTINEIQLTTDSLMLDLHATIDLNDYIAAILPEDAYSKEIYWQADADAAKFLSIADDGHTATTLAETREPIQLCAHAVHGDAFTWVAAEIYCKPKSLVVDHPEQVVSVYDILDLGYKVLPDGARYDARDIVWITSDPKVVYLGHDVYMTHRTEEINARAMKMGHATLTVSLPGEGLSATISVTVTAPEPEAIMSDGLDIMKGETGRAIFRAYPEGAYIDPAKLEVSLQDADDRWTPCRWTTGVDEDGKTYIDVDALAWGEYTLEATYPGTRGTSVNLNFGQGIELEKGWNWVSLGNALATIDGLARISEAFGDKLNDARTQYDLLYNDPEMGVFGTLTRFDAGSYKIEVTDDHYLENHCLMYNLNDSLSIPLNEEWNWMWYPYDQDYTLAELTTSGAFKYANSGDRIVAKNEGFAEYDGSKWNGTLTTLEESAGYMYYVHASNGYTIRWPAPIKLGQKNPDAKAPSRRTAMGDESVWQYDHRRFADNMTIIATLSGITFPDDCTIGAFIDGECRGEGRYVDGRFFITVHGKAGEQVSFIVHDDATDTYYTVPGLLGFDFLAGSLQHPVGMKVGDKTTDITVISSADVDGVLYDLAGRRVVSPAPGYYIRNGKMILVK